MGSQLPRRWSGRIVLQTMFRNSKSEDVYPVLHATDGLTYRIHREGDAGSSKESFAQFDNRTITISGRADNLRGHWRIVVGPADFDSIVADGCDQADAPALQTNPAAGAPDSVAKPEDLV
jgi:hypothetical protein